MKQKMTAIEQQFYVHGLELELGFADPAIPALGPLVVLLHPTPISNHVRIEQSAKDMRIIVSITGHTKEGSVWLSGYPRGLLNWQDFFEYSATLPVREWVDYVSRVSYLFLDKYGFHLSGFDDGIVAVYGVPDATSLPYRPNE